MELNGEVSNQKIYTIPYCIKKNSFQILRLRHYLHLIGNFHTEQFIQSFNSLTVYLHITVCAYKIMIKMTLFSIDLTRFSPYYDVEKIALIDPVLSLIIVSIY